MYTVDLQEIIRDFAELPSSREALLLALPGYVERHFKASGIVSVLFEGTLTVLKGSDSRFVNPGQQPPACAELQNAIRAGKTNFQTESDELPDARYVSACVLKEHALPIATLQLHTDSPLPPETNSILELFARLISSRLSLLSSSVEAATLAELVTTLMSADSVAEGAQKALDIIARRSDAEAGVLLQERLGRMEVIARYGAEADPERARALGISEQFPDGLAWQAIMSGKVMTLAVENRAGSALEVALTIVQPLGWRGTYRYVLVLRLTPRLVITPGDQALFEAISTQLHLALDRLETDLVQDRLLSLQAAVVDADTGGLYQRILKNATDLVPGAQSGSLLVRSSPERPFRYWAAVGYDLEKLKDVELDEQNMLNWYGRGVEAWEHGEPRMIRDSGTNIAEASFRAAGQREFIEGTRRIKSNICLPVVFRGNVLAFLNLDNHYDDGAFGDDSFRVLRLFAPVVANMLVTARQRDEIFGLAHTDTLTHLPNRRGSDLALASQMKRSSETGEPFVLLVMDLRNFKEVNDTYGHEVGDKVLQRVAVTISENARTGDTVSRWGGDEFAVLLPATTAEVAQQVASRLRLAVSQVAVADVHLGVDIGLAASPDDATSAGELLKIADYRMYSEKRQSRS